MPGSILALSLLLLAPPPESGFVVTGTVVDPSGAAVPAASVSAGTKAGEVASSATTGRDGRFTLTLGPGSYTVQVSAAGFSASSKPVTATERGTASLNFVLSLSKVRETVSVVAPGDYTVSTTRTATRTPTPLQDVPQSLTITTRQRISDQLMLSMGDVMRYTPGIQ